MKLPILLFSLLFFCSGKTKENFKSDIYIYVAGQRNSLLQQTCVGDILIYESLVICNGCIESIATMLRKVQTEKNVYLLSAESSSQGMRYRLNDWGKYLKHLPKGLHYDSISLSISAPSPLIVMRDSFGFKVYSQKYLYKNSVKLQKSASREFVHYHRAITR